MHFDLNPFREDVSNLHHAVLWADAMDNQHGNSMLLSSHGRKLVGRTAAGTLWKTLNSTMGLLFAADFPEGNIGQYSSGRVTRESSLLQTGAT